MREKKYSGYDLLLGGLLMALGLVFPVLFHAVGLGNAFLPMFYPFMAAGFLIALPAALVVGILTPLISALLTGMPPFYPPIAFIMMAEGAILTLLPALLYQRWKMNPWLTAIITMAADRLTLFLLIILFANLLELPPGVLSIASLLKGLPGTILIPLIIPSIIKKMEPKIEPFRALQ